MKSLTPEGSAALQVLHFDVESSQHLVDFELQAPVLVLWEDAGAEVQLRAHRGHAWHYRPRGGCLDLYAPGAYDLYHSSAGLRRKTVVTLPAHVDGCRGDRDDTRDLPWTLSTRIQFQDRALRRHIQRLRDHLAQGEPLGALYSHLLSAAIVEAVTGPGTPALLKGHAQAGLPLGVQQRLCTLLDERLDAPPAVDEMAALAACSTPHFLKAFKASFRMTVHQYVLHRRVERAKLMLSADVLSVSTVAAALGFANHAHFTTVFRSRTGITPRDWRRSRRAPPATDP